MGTRHQNPQLAKIHRNYSVEEVAMLCGVHKNTVRQWIKSGGLSVLDDQRPMLILGRELREFLTKKKTKNKCTLKPGEIYCVRCRTPMSPDGDMADYEPLTEIQGNLIGICPRCDSMIYRRISLAKIELVRGQLAITLPQALLHINERAKPSVNSDLK